MASQIRCTLKWHGYSKSASETLKQVTRELAKKHGGTFNKAHFFWEFRTPENQAKKLYSEMIAFAKKHFESTALDLYTHSNSSIQNKCVHQKTKPESIIEKNEQSDREYQLHKKQLKRTANWRASLPPQYELRLLMDEFCKATDFPTDKGFQFFDKVKTRADLRGTTPQSYALLLEEQLGEDQSRWMSLFNALDLLQWSH